MNSGGWTSASFDPGCSSCAQRQVHTVCVARHGQAQWQGAHCRAEGWECARQQSQKGGFVLQLIAALWPVSGPSTCSGTGRAQQHTTARLADRAEAASGRHRHSTLCETDIRCSALSFRMQRLRMVRQRQWSTGITPPSSQAAAQIPSLQRRPGVTPMSCGSTPAFAAPGGEGLPVIIHCSSGAAHHGHLALWYAERA